MPSLTPVVEKPEDIVQILTPGEITPRGYRLRANAQRLEAAGLDWEAEYERAIQAASYTALSRARLAGLPLGQDFRECRIERRLPGLSDPEAAYETGRALRMIGHILDSQSSPIEHGRHFVSELGNAVVFFAMRGERQPWGAEDTAFVFRETFKAAPTEAQKAHDAILGYARKQPIVNVR